MKYSIFTIKNNIYVFVSNMDNELMEFHQCSSLTEAAQIFGGN